MFATCFSSDSHPMREAKKVPTTVVRRRSKSPEIIYQHSCSSFIIIHQHGSSFISRIHHSTLFILWKFHKIITLCKFGKSHNKFFCVIRCHHSLHLVMWRPPLLQQFLHWVGCPCLLACSITLLVRSRIQKMMNMLVVVVSHCTVHCYFCKVEFPMSCWSWDSYQKFLAVI